MSTSTRARAALDTAGVSYEAHSYDDHGDADHIGPQAAARLGVRAEIVLQTLMAQVDGKPVCAVIPSAPEVGM